MVVNDEDDDDTGDDDDDDDGDEDDNDYDGGGDGDEDDGDGDGAYDGGSDDDESDDDDGDDGNFYTCMRSVYGAQNSIPPTDAITSSPSPSSWPDVSGLMQPLFFLVTELAPAARWSVIAPLNFHRI